ncbi:autophagy protein 5 isoform X2 [Juglans microcarpa x Juglans regia]|uniref:autophagy protein 5 isoform X2 n=1 Tax=Juglans microcarpa x Juglans regia TaxID=2249226 RepID=UPI001B7E9DD2|nr:autophagy protein 5 isoform X2 [Juglans microcarpa x Juglans regia]
MMEAQKYVWEGAIPLQIHLHESEVTTLPPPLPALILAPRIGYLPLLIPHIKPHFNSSLPPGVDTVWFEYKGLPLKWYIPTGVLFDLLCVEPERPWNLTVHFRGYPGNILIPCEGEDSVKWSFINSLKEASYIINGNCKNVMNMSQPDQVELWHSVFNGNLEAYLKVSSKLKLGTAGHEYSANLNSGSFVSRRSTGDTDATGQVKTGRVPVRLYVWGVSEDFDDLEDAPQIDSWDKISYINRPVEIHGEEGKCFTLLDAVKSLLPEHFQYKSLTNEESSKEEGEDEQKVPSEEGGENLSEDVESCYPSDNAEVKLVRIQGIEPKLEIPFSWVVHNLMNPEHFLHICVCLKVSQVKIPSDG